MEPVIIKKVITVGPLTSPIRLDRFIAQELAPLLTRNQWEKRQGKATHLGKELKPSYKLIGGEVLALEWEEAPTSQLLPEDIPLNILWEDEDVVVINKPRGMVVHPALGHSSGTLVQGLLYHVNDLETAFEEEKVSQLRPGIVHRLDKDTTGVLICAKNPEVLEALALQFRAKTTEKIYWAIVKGTPRGTSGHWKSGLIRDPRHRQRFTATTEDRGKWAWTEWKLLESRDRYSFLELRPHTGRTHQLRVQCSHAGVPILGDPIYTRPDSTYPNAPLMLHAHSLRIILPHSEQSQTFVADLPDDFISTTSAAGFSIPG
jgi:23S rRNA pseudouridine1911/1915/1917 synthase